MAKKRKAKRKPFIVSVKDFGARGDGHSDDSQAFKAAASTRAVKIKVPKGTYKLDEDVKVEKDIRFTSTVRG